jgi:predicted transcriptional regulator of viral defense system
MNLNDALADALLEADIPVITDYEFFMLGARIHTARAWHDQPLSRLPDTWDHARMRAAQRRLRARGAIAQDADFRLGLWRIVQAARSGSAEEVACIADPFCYVSHLSAMERYGLTERSPEALHLTTPARSVWNGLRDARLRADLELAPHIAQPPLVRFGFKGRVRRRPVTVHETRHPAQPVAVSGERTRITDIGRTFADMLDMPALCGGMHHVLEVWARNAADWQEEIIVAVDAIDSRIAKVRAGYIFTELLDITEPRINRWSAFAQRGGSRKLDPDADYQPRFSERWMISLNV